MRALVIAADELADSGIQACQVQYGVWVSDARGEVAGQGGEQFGVDGAEEPLDLAAPLRTGNS